MKEKRPNLNKIKDFVLKQTTNQARHPISRFGAVNCWYRQRIVKVPFLYPSLILVLSGSKSIFPGNNEVQCPAGDYFAIPAPSKFNVVNKPDESGKFFLALYLYFDSCLIERFRRLYQIDDSIIADNASISFKGNKLLDSAIWHFLEISGRPELPEELIEHRLMEILLCLVKCTNASHMLLSMSPKWSERVYSLLLSNPSKNWFVKDVCSIFGVSESVLRRHLRKEKSNFRTIIEDVRMGLALSEVQFTKLPISRIAENCGYTSFSRFTERFRHRFDIAPSQLRKEMTESV